MMKKLLIITGAMVLSTTMAVGIRIGMKKLSQQTQEETEES